ncbi:MAG: GNA1162 family protein, partial [Methyloceanibacter sp.]
MAQPVKKDLSAFYAAPPRSILVVPTVNRSLDVDAPNYVLSTLPVPLAEKGYYVFPVNTAKFVLEQEGLYEGERIHQQPAAALARLFHADAVLYVTINRWDAQYVVLST